MGRADKANLEEDEALAEAVKEFPCLYDKSSQHYKDNRKKENAWKLVDQELGYSFDPNCTFCFPFSK